ncbi:ABC transporter ATP-binding protein [Prosthecobacter vanneervenii]|uniref:ABC-type dipeptide/oligopeptide/nickel transport system ATPase component n=1 Tax=Prosthecobacter vanneervenii TaxID=48466 RepID=A0A7W7YB05_9BACT|nr:ABC transporter ATP-binding protein [Prosthecobacter vanneervenii]MBB5032902.1 ABC-type dipeptide/oligopeptide/nickel transport system ATPase component [Prosthecobacter vanneervenii]
MSADAPAPTEAPLLRIRDLQIEFARHGAEPMKAVKGIDLELKRGESIALVGESGSGKSATALSFARLLPEPPAVISARQMSFNGHEILEMGERDLRKIRGKEIAYIFQEPTTSLNPVLTIRTQIGEALALHRPDVPKSGRDNEIVKWLDKVGIVDSRKRLNAYPYELSGGMQQRVMIAMALCMQPKLLIADEPTTALDVTIQKQIMDLLAELRRDLDMSIILITHNLGIIRSVVDRVAVMFRGKIVETGPVDEILRNPQHAYTKALLACVPRMGAKQPRLKAIDYAELEA